MCKEDTILCCRGRLLTVAQKSYPFQGEESDPKPEETYANRTQKFLHQKFSMWTTSKIGMAIILITWLAYLSLSIYGATQVKIEFKFTYFISDGAYVKEYFDRQEEYFQSGERVTVYTDSRNIDITQYDTQAKLDAFNTNLKNCEGCQKQFTVSGSFDSWYVSLKHFS